MGETIKIGRRGSLTARLTAYGAAGPHRLPAIARTTRCRRWCACSTGWPRTGSTPAPRISAPRRSRITTIDAGNPAANVIPAEARATVNIRFNDAHTAASLSAWIEEEADRVAKEFGIGIAARFQVVGRELPDRARPASPTSSPARSRPRPGCARSSRPPAARRTPASSRSIARSSSSDWSARRCTRWTSTSSRRYPSAQGDLHAHPGRLFRGAPRLSEAGAPAQIASSSAL